MDSLTIGAHATYNTVAGNPRAVMESYAAFFNHHTPVGKEIATTFNRVTERSSMKIQLDDMQSFLPTQYGRRIGGGRASLVTLPYAPPDHPVHVHMAWGAGPQGAELYGGIDIALEPLLGLSYRTSIIDTYVRASAQHQIGIGEIIRRQAHLNRLNDLYPDMQQFILGEMPRQASDAVRLIEHYHDELERASARYIATAVRALAWLIEEPIRTTAPHRAESPTIGLSLNEGDETHSMYPLLSMDWLTLTDHNRDPEHPLPLHEGAARLPTEVADTLVQIHGNRARKN